VAYKNTKTYKLITIILLSFLLIGCNKKQNLTNELFYDTNYQLIESKDKWLIINYWAIWCKPCRNEVPELNILINHLPNHIQLIGVNYDKDSDEQIMQNINKLDINFPVLNKQAAISLVNKLPKPRGLPATYIIDNKGKLRRELIGEQTKDSIYNELTKLKAL